MWDGELKANYETQLHVPEGHNTILVVLNGEVIINGSQKVLDSSMVMFAQEDTAIQLQALHDTKFLLLSGVIEVQRGAFNGCTSLNGTLSLPSTLKYLGTAGNGADICIRVF